jgi:hypothetical protein
VTDTYSLSGLDSGFPAFKETHGVEAHPLACNVKYLRLVKRTTGGEVRCFVELILEGTPDQKEQHVISDAAALDIGPSTVAGIGADDPSLARFCDEVSEPRRKSKAARRAEQRSRRATNPGNRNPGGTVTKGSQKWRRSNRYQKRQGEIATNP